jgi:ketosteroid isomerase-like protein
MLLLISGCGQKVNDPADVEAITNLLKEYANYQNAGNAEAQVSSYFAEDAVRLVPNQPMLNGQDAIKNWVQSLFNLNNLKLEFTNFDIHTAGERAMANVTYSFETTPKIEGGHTYSGTGKAVAAYSRQQDGTWKCIYDIWNDDHPVSEIPPLGEDEQALLKIDHAWAVATVKADVAWMEQTLANDWVGNLDGRVMSKSQYLADTRRGNTKYESAAVSDQKVMVFGDMAVVHGIWTEKSASRGQDTSGQSRFTDIYIKRDGSWKCVSSYSFRVS